MSGNFYASLQQSFAAHPQKIAIETEDGQIYRFQDIDEAAARYAAFLSGLGVVPGDRVAAQTEKSPQALFLYLGCLRLGAAYLPLNTAYKKAEIGYFLGDAEPGVFICDPAREADLAPVAHAAGVRHVLTLDAQGEGTLAAGAAAASTDFPVYPAEPGALAAILYTSGTTGRSKGAMLSHQNILSNTATLQRIWGFSDADVLLHALPIYHTHGLFVGAGLALLSGAAMLFLPKFDNETVFSLLPRATVMMGVPTFYTRMLDDSRLTRENTAHMRLFISGSAPLLAATHAEFTAHTGQDILERYGMTETFMLTSNPLAGSRIPGTVGVALPDVEVRIAEPSTGAPLPTGEIGVIEVKGPNVFSGYWRMPEKTREEFRPDGFFITGDLGTLDEDGYVRIVGRGKDLIISGGFNVYPKEVETILDAIPGIAESAVFGVWHRDFGEAVVAVAVPDGKTSVEAVGVIELCREQLANFKVPKAVMFIATLPRNTMGKVQKNELRERYKDLYAKA